MRRTRPRPEPHRSPRAVGGVLLAVPFLVNGLGAVQDPQTRTQARRPLASKAPQSATATTRPPESLVRWTRATGAVQLAAGALLAARRAPRLSSGVLALSLIPITLTEHDFWAEAEPTTRATQRTEFIRNLAVLGGLTIRATTRRTPTSTARADATTELAGVRR